MQMDIDVGLVVLNQTSKLHTTLAAYSYTLMCLGCVCTRSFANPYGHGMPADLYQQNYDSVLTVVSWKGFWFCFSSLSWEEIWGRKEN